MLSHPVRSGAGMLPLSSVSMQYSPPVHQSLGSGIIGPLLSILFNSDPKARGNDAGKSGMSKRSCEVIPLSENLNIFNFEGKNV
jgi:hypothetical protein